MYERRSFNSGTDAPPYNITAKTREDCVNFRSVCVCGGGGGRSNNKTKLCLNPFTISKVIQSSTMPSRNQTLAKLMWVKLKLKKVLKKGTLLSLNAPITTIVVCFSRLLKCLRRLYGKQCGPRSDCSYRSSLF